MKLICINNSGIINGPIELLTINKTYEAIKTFRGQYYIKDNSGDERWFNSNRFKDIATIREEKLKQIGI
jgi:hypothetical protein